MSETLIFHDRGITEPAHRAGVRAGLSASASVHRPPEPEQVAERLPGPEGATTTRSSINRTQLGGGFYLAGFAERGIPGRRGIFGISATFGLAAVGMDATLQLYRRNYLTYAHSAQGGHQLYLNHRAFNSPHAGLAIGVGYRRDDYFYDVESEYPCEWQSSDCISSQWGFPSPEVVRSHSVGLRGLALLRSDAGASTGVTGRVFVGYSESFDMLVVHVGMSMGGF
jgi:hypothetical protein